MNPDIQRAFVLLRQGRYDLADREFRRGLAQAPDDPQAHAFLALCLTHQDRDDEALREAEEAIRLDPDLPLAHYVRGSALASLGRHREAEESAREAIQLDPHDADLYALLAQVELARDRKAEALDAADHGLSIDPEHDACRNLRAMALVQLGRKAEAARTLGSALADDPDNPLTHANQGWTLLHQGNHVQALEHFREALRLDPDLDWARAGMVEALKARSPIYRVMLGFFLWMGRQSQKAQWAIFLGFIVGRRVLADVAKSNPGLSPYIQPILIASFIFIMMTWLASPLANTLLRFNRFGRMALSRAQRVESNWIGGSALLALASLTGYVLTGQVLAELIAGFFGFLLLPLAATFQVRAGRARLLPAALTAVMIGMGIVFFGSALLEDLRIPNPLLAVLDPTKLVGPFILGAFASTWIPALSMTVNRDR